MNGSATPNMVIVDADNTLYDWVRYFASYLRAALFDLRTITGVPLPKLAERLSAVFRKHGTVEYRYFLTELATANGLQLAAGEVARVDTAVQSRGRRALVPYPGVRSGLRELRDAGVVIVCISDSTRYHLLSRLDQAGLAQYFSATYTSPDYEIPYRFREARSNDMKSLLNKYPHLHVRNLPAGVRKPSPKVLETVLSDMGRHAEECVMLGDNLRKDIVMAKAGSVFDCWAEYGLPRASTDVELLVSVTDWTAADVERFYANRPERCGIVPSFSAMNFGEFIYLVLNRWDMRQYESCRVDPPQQLCFLDLPGAPL